MRCCVPLEGKTELDILVAMRLTSWWLNCPLATLYLYASEVPHSKTDCLM